MNELVVIPTELTELEEKLKSLVVVHKQNFIDFCETLHTIYDKQYYKKICANFSDYIQQQIDLDMTPQYAYRMVAFFTKATKELGLSKEDLLKHKPSKLLEVFALPVDRKDDILKLLEDKESTVKDVKEKVKQLTGKDDFVSYHLKFSRDDDEQTIQPALEKLRSLHGSVVDKDTGEVVDITPSRCFYYMAVEALNLEEEQEIKNADVGD